MQSDNQRSTTDEFYQGYSPTIPQGIRRFLWILIPLIAVIVVVLSVVLPAIHNQYSTGTFTTPFREYEGLLMDKPVPHLMIPRQGQTNSDNAYSRYVLAGTRKTSVDPKILEFAGNWVKIKALPVFRDGMTLLAVRASATPEIIDPPPNQSLIPQGKTLGNFTLAGEIVDTKCNLGVMKPGQLKVHRDCAIRCISGGVPPSLRVVDASGNIEYFLLVDSQSKAVNSKILDIIADPVSVTGEVVQYGDLFVLKADPDNYDLL